jgi:hypothetical protein
MHTRLPARSARIQPAGASASSKMRPPAARAAARRLDVLASDGHVDVHRVPERLGRVEFLHPDRRAVAEGVDGVVVVQARVPEDSAPEADVDRVGFAAIASWTFCAPVRSATAPCARAIAETARASAMCRSSSRDTPRVNRTLRQPSAMVNTVPEPSRPGTCATASASCVASPSDGTRNTAVAPPCRTTQSSRLRSEEISPALLAHARLPYTEGIAGLRKGPLACVSSSVDCANGRERSSA